jgi:hypothetical protein
MAKIIPKESKMSKSCNKNKPKITKAMEISTAAKRIGYAIFSGIVWE